MTESSGDSCEQFLTEVSLIMMHIGDFERDFG